MGWIGLRQDNVGVFQAAGLGRTAPPAPSDPETLLPRGTLLCEFIHRPAPVRRNIIRFSSRIPWSSSLSLCIDPDGTAHLLTAQHRQALAFALPTSLGPTMQTVIASYSWNAPARRGVFSLHLPDSGALHQTEVSGPQPLSLRDARRIISEPACCRTDPDVGWLALSDRVEPAGPIATLAAAALIDTPGGPCEVHRLRPGHHVTTEDGSVAQVRWAGFQDLPARGRYAPLLIRAPYFGLTSDLYVAPCQRLRLKGSEVEYLFGEEEVSAAAAHLIDGRTILRAPPMLTIRYHQILLDRQANLRVSGAAMETMDISLLQADPGALPHSLLATVPPELLPQRPRFDLPVLRAFEAVTLAAARAA